MSDLASKLRSLAESPVLLVASDFDGTLSPLVDRPEDARPDPRAWEALRTLASLPHTHVAVITGRARADAISRLPGIKDLGISLIGSHGLEVGEGEIRLAVDARDRLASVLDLLHAESMELPNSQVEIKPASATFHVRRAERKAGDAALERIRRYGLGMSGVTVIDGDRVVELCVLSTGKGRALNRVRYEVGATAALFVGDDTTDEAAFAVLGPRDAAIKIGPGTTVAAHRIERQDQVGPMLEELLNMRRMWARSRDETLTPIERHAMLSDQRSLALVDPRGRIVWGCLPRLDAPPIFASLLGNADAGEFVIAPADAEMARSAAQRYDTDSFVLNTIWAASGRTITLTDYLDVSGGRAYQRSGRSELIRVVEGVGRVRIRFAPRLDFGRVGTTIRPVTDGLEVDGWSESIVLRSPGVAWKLTDSPPHTTAEAEIELSGEPFVMELRVGTSSTLAGAASEHMRREQSRRFWSGWASSLSTTALHAPLVKRSALVIKALCHGPSGAIAAAATTSLPEHMGGVRNWDYRYCWVRDACMSASALATLGNTGVGMRLLDWLVGVVGRNESPERLRPLYTVTGDVLGPEAEISELAGYGGSRPVRVGNAASQQVQLDVFGPIVELVSQMSSAGAPVTPEQWRLVESMVAAVERRWQEPDHGIWEIRGPKRHHVHTKAMCWLALDRGSHVAELAMGRPRPQWRALRDRIADEVLSRGVDPQQGCFTAAYGESSIDASTLLLAICGMVPPGDARFVRTVEVVEKQLGAGPAVYRYLVDDGLPGREGAWVICATWLVEALALVGRLDDARALLAKTAALAGPLGLLAEEYDVRHRLALGNFPQAYSHLGIINAAVRLDMLLGIKRPAQTVGGDAAA